MDWDSDFGLFGTIILFIAVLCMALLASAGSGTMDSFPLITGLTYLASAGLAGYHCYKYKQNGVSLWVAIPFTYLSELAFATILLLVLRDVALVATGPFLLNLLGVMLSLPVALLVVGVCKFPNILATAVGHEICLVIIDGIATLGLVVLFCNNFGFSLSYLF